MKRFMYGVALVSFGVLGMLLISDFAGALEFSTDPIPIEFTLNSVLTLSTDGNIAIPNLTPGNSAISSNDYTVTVNTNNVAGYVLSASVGCASGDGCFNSNVLGDGNSNTFTMVDSTTTLTPGKWGVSFDSSATTSSNFQNLPLYSATPAIINQTTDAAGTAATGYQGTGVTTFRVGAYAADTQVAGTYTNVVNFTAVANIVIEAPGECGSVETCMQTFTADMCEAQTSDAPITLTDARDGNTYTVRYIEGACWMTQNLRITGTVSSEYSNFSTYSSINVCEGDLTAGDTYDYPRCHDSNNTTKGVWYNYVSASAKTITGGSNSILATEDICPANWHLPSYNTNKTAGSINSLYTYGTLLLEFSPVTGGYYINGSSNYVGYGYWWSTAANSDGSRYYLAYDGSSLYTDYYYGSSTGRYIRCVRL